MKIYDKKVEHNSRGYKKVTGKIYTTKEITLLNPSNNGKSPLDANWNKNDYLTLPEGSYVDYKMNTNHMGDYHNISVVMGGVKFFKTVLV